MGEWVEVGGGKIQRALQRFSSSGGCEGDVVRDIYLFGSKPKV